MIKRIESKNLNSVSGGESSGTRKKKGPKSQMNINDVLIKLKTVQFDKAMQKGNLNVAGLLLNQIELLQQEQELLAEEYRIDQIKRLQQQYADSYYLS